MSLEALLWRWIWRVNGLKCMKRKWKIIKDYKIKEANIRIYDSGEKNTQKFVATVEPYNATNKDVIYILMM